MDDSKEGGHNFLAVPGLQLIRGYYYVAVFDRAQVGWLMPSHPLMIVSLVLAVLAVAGIVAAVIHEVRLFSGFRDIAPEAKTIANHLRGDVFRDCDDLVITGQYEDIPIVVRFSHQENAPAVGLYARIPAACQFSLIPKQIAGSSFFPNIKLRSRILEERFVATSVNPLELELLLNADKTVWLLETLCCSPKTIFEVNRGRLELLEMDLPEELARHVIDHLPRIRDFADLFATMPGSDRVKIIPLRHEGGSWIFKAGVAAGVVVVAMLVIAATREHGKVQGFSVTDSGSVRGVQVDDASVIDAMDPWRVAKAEEFDARFANWLRRSGKRPASRIEFNPMGNRSSRGVAYLLVREDGSRRVVIIVDHHPVFDTCFPRIDGIAVVPVTSFPKLKWGQWQAPAQKPEGDAILVVRDAADSRSAELLFFPNGTLFSGVPRDYSGINLQQVN